MERTHYACSLNLSYKCNYSIVAKSPDFLLPLFIIEICPLFNRGKLGFCTENISIEKKAVVKYQEDW